MFRSVPQCSVLFQCSVVPNAKNDFGRPFKKNKKFFMQKKDVLLLLVLLVVAWCLYYYGRGFWSGFVAGLCLAIGFLATVGKVLARKAITRVNANIKNSILYPKAK